MSESIHDAIEMGKRRHSQAISKVRVSRKDKPISFSSMRVMFGRLLEEESGMSTGIIYSRGDLQIMRGLAKLLQNTGYTHEDTEILFTRLIKNWDVLTREDLITLKGRNYKAGARPNLRDFAVCRISMIERLEMIDSSKHQKVEETSDFLESLKSMFDEE